jgi:hypothetical protein
MIIAACFDSTACDTYSFISIGPLLLTRLWCLTALRLDPSPDFVGGRYDMIETELTRDAVSQANAGSSPSHHAKLGPFSPLYPHDARSVIVSGSYFLSGHRRNSSAGAVSWV